MTIAFTPGRIRRRPPPCRFRSLWEYLHSQSEPEIRAEPGFEKELHAFNLFKYLSRSDVTWNPSVTSVCGRSLFCPTTEEYILPIIHGNDRVEWFMQLSDEITWEVADRETGRPRAADHEGGRRRRCRPTFAIRASRRSVRCCWSGRTRPRISGRLLLKLADAIEAHADELAHIEAIDTGHPMRDTRALDAPRTAATFRYFGGMADKVQGTVVPVEQGFLNYVLHRHLRFQARAHAHVSGRVARPFLHAGARKH